MNINDLQKARRENDFEKIVDIIWEEHWQFGGENRDKYQDEDYKKAYDKTYSMFNKLSEQLCLEIINKNGLKLDYLKLIPYESELLVYKNLLKYLLNTDEHRKEVCKNDFENNCKENKDIIFIDEKYQQQKKISKFNISHLGIKLSKRFRPKCLKRLVLNPYKKMNSEIYYELACTYNKKRNFNKKIEYLKKGAYQSNVNCVKELADLYELNGQFEERKEILHYGAVYDYVSAGLLASELVKSDKEEDVNKAISILLIYHALNNEMARESLAKIFASDKYGKENLGIAMLLYSSIGDGSSESFQDFLLTNREYFISKTDESVEKFIEIKDEFDKISGDCEKVRLEAIRQEEIRQEEIKKEELRQEKIRQKEEKKQRLEKEKQEEAERIKREAESMKRRASYVSPSYDLSNLDKLLVDVTKDSILMSSLVTIYLENNLKFDSKFINVIINNCHGWKREWAEVMRAILFKYGYARNLQIKDKKYGLMINNAKTVKYKPEDAFEIFKYIANKGNNGILESRARYELAKCYAEGYGTAKDKAKAKKYFAMVNSKYTNLFTSAQKDRQTVLAEKASKASDKALAIKNKNVKGMLKAYSDDNEVIFKVIDIYLKDKLPLDSELANCVLDYKQNGKSSRVINFMVALLYRYGYINNSNIKDYSTVTAYYEFEENALRGDGLIKTRARYELAKCWEEGYSVEKNIDKAIGHYELCDKAYAKKLQDKQGTQKVVEHIPEKKRIENFVTNAYETFLKEYPEKGKIVEYRTNRFFLNDVDMKFIYELLNNGYQMYYLFNDKGDYIGASYLGVKGIKDFASVKSEIDKKDRLEREHKLEEQKQLEEQKKLQQKKQLEEKKRLEEDKKLKEQTKKVTTSSVNITSKISIASTSNNATNKQTTTTTSTQNTTTASAQVNTSKNVNLSTSGANAKLNEVRKKYGYVEKPTGELVDENGNKITSTLKIKRLATKRWDEYYKSQGVYEKNIFNAVKESSNRKCNQIDEKTLFAINDSKPIHDKSGFEFEINHNYKKMVQNYKKNYIRHLGDLGDIGVEITDIKYCNSKGQVMNDVWIAERELAGLPVYAKVVVEVEIYDNCLTFKSDIDYISEMYNLMNAFEESDLAKFSTFSEFTQKTTLGFETEQRSKNMRHSAIADGKDVYKQVIRKAVSNTFKNNHVILHEKAIVRNNIFPAYVTDYSLQFKWSKQY